MFYIKAKTLFMVALPTIFSCSNLNPCRHKPLYKYRLFNVLCWLWNIYERAPNLHPFESILHLVFFGVLKKKNGEIDIFGLQLPLIKLWEVIVIV